VRRCVRTHPRTLMSLNHLTDAVVLVRLEALVSQERGSVADIIEHLAEVDRREIVIDAGYTTLFDYCVKTLRYSEAAAFTRIRAARAVAEFPRVLADLRSGALHLDAVARLSPHLSADNSDKILDQASGATKREVLALVASLDPDAAAPERDVIRILPPAKSPVPIQAGELKAEVTVPDIPRSGGSAPDAVIAPASRVRLGFTADNDFLLMVDRLRALRRHVFPEGRLEDLLNEAVSTLLDKVDPERRVSRARTKKGNSTGTTRWISAALKAEIWKRDGGRCAYLSDDGRRCESRDCLEYDHIVPWADGGLSSVDNLRLLCRPHNLRLGRRKFGPRRRAPTQVCPDTPEQGRREEKGAGTVT
jgi:5-methylcytosine-specific restriction endonuclease McrA